MNRPGNMGERRRRLQRLVGKQDWFKKKRRNEEKKRCRKVKTKSRKDMTEKEREKELQQKEIEAVLFIPFTPGSELCRAVQEVDDEFVLGTDMKRVKVVERVGVPEKNVFHVVRRQDPHLRGEMNTIVT